MNRPEKLLAVLLKFAGVLLMTAVVPAVMPFSWMQEIHRLLGMGELPEGPIVGYLTRSLSAMYAMHGAVLFFVSTNIDRYLPVIRFLAVAGVAFGLSMLVLDARMGMPPMWIAGEGPFIVVLCGVVLWLARRCQLPPYSSRSA